MPIKYIGRTTDFRGKTLWEILGNLKDFGVGRYVVRSMFERYPEPSYMKICKVEALANPSDDLDPRKIRVWVEKVFRGRKYPDLVEMHGVTYKPDYRLIPKHEEEEYCKPNTIIPLEKVKLLPRTMPFPPLLREMILKEKQARGEDVTEEPLLQLKYSESIDKLSRIAREDEVPHVKFEPGIGTPLSPELYANIQQRQ